MANRYIVAQTDWNSTDTWSTTSGGVPGASVPTINDTAIYDANSPVSYHLTMDVTVGGFLNLTETDDNTATKGFHTNGVTRTMTIGSSSVSAGQFIWRPTVTENFSITRFRVNFYGSSMYVNTSCRYWSLYFYSTCEFRQGYQVNHFRVMPTAHVSIKNTVLPGYTSYPVRDYFYLDGGSVDIQGLLDVSETESISFAYAANIPSWVMSGSGKVINRSGTTCPLVMTDLSHFQWLDSEGLFSLSLRFRGNMEYNRLSGQLKNFTHATLTAVTGTAAPKLVILEPASPTISSSFHNFSLTGFEAIPLQIDGELPYEAYGSISGTFASVTSEHNPRWFAYGQIADPTASSNVFWNYVTDPEEKHRLTLDTRGNVSVNTNAFTIDGTTEGILHLNGAGSPTITADESLSVRGVSAAPTFTGTWDGDHPDLYILATIDYQSMVEITTPVAGDDAVRLIELEAHEDSTDIHLPGDPGGGEPPPIIKPFWVICRRTTPGRVCDIPDTGIDPHVYFQCNLGSTTPAATQFDFIPMYLPGIDDLETVDWALEMVSSPYPHPHSTLVENGRKILRVTISGVSQSTATLTVSKGNTSYSFGIIGNMVTEASMGEDTSGLPDALIPKQFLVTITRQEAPSVPMPDISGLTETQPKFALVSGGSWPKTFRVEPHVVPRISDLSSIDWALVLLPTGASITQQVENGKKICYVTVTATSSTDLQLQMRSPPKIYTVLLNAIDDPDSAIPADTAGITPEQVNYDNIGKIPTVDQLTRVYVMTATGPKWQYANISCIGCTHPDCNGGGGCTAVYLDEKQLNRPAFIDCFTEDRSGTIPDSSDAATESLFHFVTDSFPVTYRLFPYNFGGDEGTTIGLWSIETNPSSLYEISEISFNDDFACSVRILGPHDGEAVLHMVYNGETYPVRLTATATPPEDTTDGLQCRVYYSSGYREIEKDSVTGYYHVQWNNMYPMAIHFDWVDILGTTDKEILGVIPATNNGVVYFTYDARSPAVSGMIGVSTLGFQGRDWSNPTSPPQPSYGQFSVYVITRTKQYRVDLYLEPLP